MAIGLKNIRQRKQVANASQDQVVSSPSYPWSDTKSLKNTEQHPSNDQVAEGKEENLPRDLKARQAVLKARKILQDNHSMINQIHERRLGKDVRPLPAKENWSNADDYLFFIKNNSPSSHNWLDKFRNWVWGINSKAEAKRFSE